MNILYILILILQTLLVSYLIVYIIHLIYPGSYATKILNQLFYFSKDSIKKRKRIKKN